MAKEDYGNYQEFLRLGRSVKKMCELDCDQSIELY